MENYAVDDLLQIVKAYVMQNAQYKQAIAQLQQENEQLKKQAEAKNDGKKNNDKVTSIKKDAD